MTRTGVGGPLFKALVGAALLVVPFGLRLLSPHLEPYPAVLLPSGAGVIPVDGDVVSFERLALVGVDAASGEEKELAPDAFLAPAPLQYLRAITGNHFGLETEREREVALRGLPFAIVFERPEITDAERDEARAWLRARLRDAGCDDALLRVRRYRTHYDVAVREAKNEELVVEQRYRLR